jgi:3-oxoacyl-(acyl-carrier-protein) synthase
MRRVVVTGLGIVSSIGNNREEVLDSLRAGRSGIEYIDEYKELGFRSHIAGTVNINTEELIDRKLRRFMGNSAAYNYIAMQEAVADAGLADNMVSNERTGLIAGSGGASTENVSLAVDPLHGAENHVEHELRLPGNTVQDSRRQLFHQFRLFHQRPLHRQWLRTHSMGQAGYRVCRWR